MPRRSHARRGRAAAALVALTLGASLTPLAHAQDRLDWEIDEAPAGPIVSHLRGVRDGVLELLDAASDLQIGVFSEAALLGGAALAAGSDVVGLVDDNAISQYVMRGVASKSLARTGYLMHLAGAESILGSHGLEKEWYVAAAFAELNPLLDEEQAEPRLPLPPLAFASEAYVHTDVYTAHVPGTVILASVVADGLARPAGALLRISGFRETGQRVIDWGNGWLRRVLS